MTPSLIRDSKKKALSSSISSLRWRFTTLKRAKICTESEKYLLVFPKILLQHTPSVPAKLVTFIKAALYLIIAISGIFIMYSEQVLVLETMTDFSLKLLGIQSSINSLTTRVEDRVGRGFPGFSSPTSQIGQDHVK
jgi:hypothetical protein